MVVGLFAKIHRIDFVSELERVVDWLAERGCRGIVEEKVAQRFGLRGTIESAPSEEIPRLADVIVVFGGDGTLLSVARLIRGEKCPILGVNLGSLGFLTEVTVDRLYDAIEAVIQGHFDVEQRCMLHAKVKRQGNGNHDFVALNDVVINKAALARVISVDAFFDDQFIANFVADGMIVSTPTGSTAYSLSAGGPIVFPTLESIVITPICPHTLTHRPLIIPASHQIRFVLRSGEDVMLTIDGQVGVRFEPGDEVVCTRSPNKVELVRPGDKTFFDVLSEKMKWGKR